ncbi:RagB/SusD family nutrient uptake outer membrane protein [Joostella sp.]|uniref:RagB/SusD family nutrient uptake outer membrane protein n=1 Tax=Joostella sp. TaxID=2231138 RepID=UPI003A91DC61
MRYKIYFTALVGALTLTSCGDDFLETEPTEFISSDQIDEATELNPSTQEGTVRGLYATMFTTGSGGTDLDHDDFGQKGYDIYTDMLSGDMVLAGLTYGWYSDISQLQSTIDYTDNANYKPWRYYYRIILGANMVIKTLGGNDFIPDTDEGKYGMGQAKAMRAYSYFYLANLFTEGYNPTEEILPIYTEAEEENQPLSTTDEVYSLIINDLNDAISLLSTFERANKSEVNQWVAKGLLAYTYASMGKNAEVKTITNDIITNGGFILANEEEALGGFNNVGSKGWMWGTDITLDNGLDLVSWWGQVDLFTYSYAWAGDPKSIDDGLYESIREDDVRKDQFVDAYGDGVLFPLNKFYAPGREVGGQRSVETDYVYMRIAEMYLLHAEAAAKTGDEGTAIQSLKVLLNERVEDPSYVDALSGQALLDEIYLQTRIELWGEGKSYLAMKRNKATITRGPNHLSFAGESFSYDDDRLSFDIPQDEIQNNPFIN